MGGIGENVATVRGGYGARRSKLHPSFKERVMAYLGGNLDGRGGSIHTAKRGGFLR